MTRLVTKSGKRPTYPAYKPSGVEWLGDVPEHWGIIRFKYVLWLQGGHDLPGTEFQEGKYPVCGSNGYIGYHSQFTTKGPGITVGRSGSVGEVNYIDTDYWAHNTALYVKEFRQAIPKYSYYLLKTLDVKYLSAGTAVGTLNRNYIHDLLIAVPVIKEQHVITAFLDRETERIDVLIEKKQRQIELLQEKRAALISHAVTRGLDPNAKMKDSGVEWLGKIPEHWRIMAIKFALAMPITDGPHETPEFLPEGIPFLSAESVKDDQLDFNRKRGFISEEDHTRFSKKYVPKRGDVYMVKSGATTGNVARVETDEVFNIWSPLAVLRPHPARSNTDFIFYFMKSRSFLASVELAWSYGTQQNIGMGVVSNLWIALPLVQEQNAIAAILNTEIEKSDAFIGKVRDSIEKLREYRTALISAAVTGKIDVRNEVLA